MNFSVVLFSISLGIQFAIIFHVTNVITFCYYIAKVIEKYMFYFVVTIILCVSNSNTSEKKYNEEQRFEN